MYSPALEFAGFLDGCADVKSFAKNYLAVGFKLDYIKADGNVSNYIPDFIVRLQDDRIIIVETKGQSDLDVPMKMARLKHWCDDVNRAKAGPRTGFVYVDQESFHQYQPTDFAQVLAGFKNCSWPVRIGSGCFKMTEKRSTSQQTSAMEVHPTP